MVAVSGKAQLSPLAYQFPIPLPTKLDRLVSNGENMITSSPGESMQCLFSQGNGEYHACLLPNANFVVYGPESVEDGVTFATMALNNVGPFKLIMQGDGNLVIYNGEDYPVWNAFQDANAANKARDSVGPFTFIMQVDGNAVIYDSRGFPIWSTWFRWS